MMDSQLNTDKNSYKPLLSNKQVVAIFFAGLLMLLIAFGAGLSIIKNSLTNDAKPDEPKTTKPQPKPEATTQSTITPTDSNVQSAETPVAMKYTIKFQVYGTKEAAERARAELRSKNYWSAYIQEPTGQDTLYQVNIGPYDSRDEAQKIINELSTQGYKGLMVYTSKN
jgi:cell division septation protein DedD